MVSAFVPVAASSQHQPGVSAKKTQHKNGCEVIGGRDQKRPKVLHPACPNHDRMMKAERSKLSKPAKCRETGCLLLSSGNTGASAANAKHSQAGPSCFLRDLRAERSSALQVTSLRCATLLGCKAIARMDEPSRHQEKVSSRGCKAQQPYNSI